MQRSRIDEIATTLDDIAIRLDELKDEGCLASEQLFDRMRQSLERATDAIDRMANREGQGPGDQPQE